MIKIKNNTSVFSVLVVAALLVSGFFMANLTRAGGNTFYVTMSGNDSTGDGSVGTPYLTIKKAVDIAISGDTINVAAGTYIEQISIDKNLTIVGAGRDTTTIQAPAVLANDPDGAKTIVLFTGAITAEISGFTIQGPVNGLNFGIYVRDGATANIHDNTVKDIRDEPLSGNQYGYGIEIGKYNNTFPFVNQVGHAIIKNNIVFGYQKTGIEVEGASSSGTITGNTVTGAGLIPTTSQNGIQIRRGATGTIGGPLHSDANTVIDNAYTGHEVNATGISVTYPGNDVIIQGNIVNHNTANIYTNEAHGVQILNNQVSDAADGRVMAGITADSDNVATALVGIAVTITGNTVKNNLSGGSHQGPGIFLWGVNNGTVSGNEIAGSGDDGLLIGASGNVAITNNLFSTNGFNSFLSVDPNAAAIDFGGVVPELESYGLWPNTLGGFAVHNNSFVGNRNGIRNYDNGSVNATNNYWGAVSGPGSVGLGTGDKVSANINYSPWCTNTGCTEFGPVMLTSGENKTGYTTIQSAINAANPNDTINVAAGTYITNGQVIINKNLTIVGADKATTIIKPNYDTPSGGDDRGWFLVPSGKTFNISNVTLDGTGHQIGAGIYYWGNGTVNNCNITSIKYNESTDYLGRGVFIKGNVNVTNSTFTNIGRDGIQYYGGSGTASGNTYTGKGAGDWLDYAFDIDNGAIVTIQNNTISNNIGVSLKTTPHYDSAAIEVATAYGSGAQATINGNTATGNTIGVAVVQGGINQVIVHANNNNLSGNSEAAIETFDTTNTIDATNNWWGNASGPAISTNPNGTGSAIVSTSTTSFNPWFTNVGMTTLNTYSDVAATGNHESGQANLSQGTTDIVLNDTTVLDLSTATTSMAFTPVTIDGNTVILTQSATLQSGINGEPVVLTNSNLPDVSASIPDETKISGPAGWDGTIMPPTDAPSDGTAPAGFSVGGTVISIGSPDGTLVFDKAVTILLSGVTGTVAYRPALSDTWIQITNVCGGNYDTPEAPTYPGECAINNSTDTKIVTYHFTSFGELNLIPPVTGGFVGGVANYNWPAPTPTPTPTVTPTPTPQGQVLGEAITRGNPANLTANGLKEGDSVSAGGTSDPDVYIVNQFGYKRLFLNPVIFNMYGHLKAAWSNVKNIIATARDSFPTSGLFRNCETNDQKVYAIETTGEDTATLHWVNLTGDQAVTQDPEFFKKVFCINSAEFNWYSKSATDFTALSQVPVYSRK